MLKSRRVLRVEKVQRGISLPLVESEINSSAERRLPLETVKSSDQLGVPQLVLPSSDQIHGSLPARPVGSIKRKKLAQEPPGGSLIISSDLGGDECPC